MAFVTRYGNQWSENGWRMVDQNECVWSTIPGTRVSVQLRKGIPTTVLIAFMARFNELIEPLGDRDTAGLTLTNAVPTSNHMAGTAVDLNWDSHPFHVKGTFGKKLPALRKLLQEFEGSVWWGGDWKSPIDEMHFQMGWPEGDERYGPFINKLVAGSKAKKKETGEIGLTAETLAQAMGSSLPMDRYAALLPAVKAALLQCSCTTLNRISMWMAQIGHESGGLRWMEEIADGSQYEGRADLGNLQRGDGRKFKGRSPIQVTGRYNYTKVSEWAHGRGLVPTATFFVDHPDELASDTYGFIGVVWYWVVARDMNSYADAGDIVGATRAVNGGTNGLADRTDRWNRCLSMGYEAFAIPSETYGLPRGTNITYGSPGFPQWVYDLGNHFHVKASTYPGHQEGQRAESGYAPNPSGLNRGIDWAGTTSNLQKFADYLLGVRSSLEQVIWENPDSGKRVGVAGGENVSGTPYFGADYAGHRDHVHTRQSVPIPLPEQLRKKQEGIFMALTEAEQRELLDLARQEAGYRRVSRSPMRRLGEGPTETIAGFQWNMDGSVHLLLVELLASLGHPPTLSLLAEVAHADPASYPDRQEDRKIAQAILNKLQMGEVAAKTVVYQQLPPDPAPPTYVPPTYVEPTPAPTPAPAAVQPAPPRPPATPTGDGTLAGDMNDLRGQIHQITESLAALSNSFLGGK